MKLATTAQDQGSFMFENLVNIGRGKALQPYKPGMYGILGYSHE